MARRAINMTKFEKVQREQTTLNRARERVAEADATNDVVAMFEARSTLINYSKHSSFVHPTASELADAGAFMDEKRIEVENETLRRAWVALPDRLTKDAARYEDEVKKWATKLIASTDAGDGLAEFGWSQDALRSAARARVRRGFARFAKELQGRDDLTPEKGFEALFAAIDEEFMRKARYQRWSSTSMSSNQADEAERLALAELTEVKDRLRMNWDFFG